MHSSQEFYRRGTVPTTLRQTFASVVAAMVLMYGGEALCQNPGAHWQTYKSVEQAGFSPEGLKVAKAFYDSIQSSAFMIVQSGRVVAAWGEVSRRFKVHSIRKSLINSLYGIHIANGTIDTSLTLGQLHITDIDTLSPLEQSSKIIHLLKARSGVYHPAAAEMDWVKEYRPKRNSHPPNSFWFYNNWDFNVMGTIFERLVHVSVFQALHDEIAVPLQMEDYKVMDGCYFYERDISDHPAYHMKMSARDLARYGQLFLQKGRWNDRQILPEQWVEASIYPHSKHGGGTKIGRWYGYLWGVSEYFSKYKMFFASGVGGQFLAVFPTEDLVLVNRTDTYLNKQVLDRELTRLFDLILAAKTGIPSPAPELVTIESPSRVPAEAPCPELDRSKYVGSWTIDGRNASIREMNGDLVITDFDQNFRLLPISPSRFFVEDIEMYLNVEFDYGGLPSKFYYDK
jgi:CubicO group peptidase (beta-lactamase class C family)